MLVSADPNAHRLVGLFKRFVVQQYAATHSPDERELDPLRFLGRLEQNGFDIVRVHALDFFLGPLVWLLPGLRQPVLGVAVALDSLLTTIPGVQRFGSSFYVVARKRA